MAKVTKPAKVPKPPKVAKVAKPAAPDHLTMNLFAPGMTALHRAGLGGLACTLKAIERHHEAGLLRDDTVPGEIIDGEYPWVVDEQSVTLRFGKPECAGAYLKALFAFAFQIRDGVIFLPGQYGNVPPSLAVRAALQDGLLLSLYDHGPQSRSITEVSEVTTEIDDIPIVFRVARLGWYTHESDGAAMAHKSLSAPVEISRMYYPGAIVRHNIVTSSSVTMTAERLVPILFAPVGTFALRMGAKRVMVNGKRTAKAGATLIIPEFVNLNEAVKLLPALLPQTLGQTKAASVGDAILGAEVRMRGRQLLASDGIAGVRAVWCCATNWNARLQPPSKVIQVAQEAFTDRLLDRYERAWVSLPPCVRVARPEQNATEIETGSGFWTNSAARALIAENLASGRKWYASFVTLFVSVNPATNKPYRNQLHYERGGLHAMIADETMWDEAGERQTVEAIHEAMRNRYGQIADENQNNQIAMKNRMKRFRERLRLALAGAKREADVRFALTDLFCRGGNNAVLREHWTTVLPILRGNWQLARDLGLLALASYAGRDDTELTEPNPTPDQE